jgi:hypothetical protein
MCNADARGTNPKLVWLGITATRSNGTQRRFGKEFHSAYLNAPELLHLGALGPWSLRGSDIRQVGAMAYRNPKVL